MRRKKHKSTRRAVRYYKINHGFRAPFKIILDGNFVHATEAAKRGDPNELITKLLGAPSRLFTTLCVMRELRSMGKEYQDTRMVCKRFALHKCGCSQGTSAADCLASCIGESNEHHFFIATQDRVLRRNIMRLPAGASIFASVNGLQLETPGEMVKKKKEEGMSKRMADAEAGTTHLASPLDKVLVEQAREKEHPGSGGGGGDDGDASLVRFKRKKAKGPNPLSMKKKKKNSSGGGKERKNEKAGIAKKERDDKSPAPPTGGGGGGGDNNNNNSAEQQDGDGEEGPVKAKRKRTRKSRQLKAV